MPRLSDSMEEGTILKWLKSPGDKVELGDELVEIETDKANMVYEADAGGTLIEIVAAEGDTLPIGEVIARVGEPGEAPSGDGRRREGRKEKTPKSRAPKPRLRRPLRRAGHGAAPPDTPPASGRTDGRVKASPLARRIAQERGPRPAGLAGLGAGRAHRQGRRGEGDRRWAGPRRGSGRRPPRRARRTDARRRASARRPRRAVDFEELTKLQQTVARRMAESKATAPHFYLSVEIDMSRAVEARAQLKAGARRATSSPSFNDMVVKACAHRAARVPARQRRLPRRPLRALLARQRRHRGGRPGRAGRADRLRRRPQGAARRSPTEARALAQRVRDGRSRRPSSPAEPSPSPTSACSASTASPR